MKYIKKVQLSLLLILISTLFGYGQFCADFHKTGDCRADIEPSYRYYDQSRSDMIGVGYTLKYNVIFYGKRNYKISFCTNKNYYPVHFKLIDALTEKVLYDNKDDDYLESLGFGMENTKQILIEVEVIAEKASDREIEEFYPCIGMFLQFKQTEE